MDLVVSVANLQRERVMVVGFANTAADAVEELTECTEEFYPSHCHRTFETYLILYRDLLILIEGSQIPLLLNVDPFDHTMTLRNHCYRVR
jgi:hypothetical protein